MDRLSSAPLAATAHHPLEKQCKVYLIIYHPQSHKVLLHTKSELRPSGAPRLPCFPAKPGPSTHFFHETAQWIPVLQRQLRILFDVTLLRYIWYNKEHSEHCYPCSDHAILVLESHGDAVTLPDRTEWMETCCISRSQVVAEGARTAIELFLEECRTGVQPQFRSYFEPRGWYDSTVSCGEESALGKWC